MWLLLAQWCFMLVASISLVVRWSNKLHPLVTLVTVIFFFNGNPIIVNKQSKNASIG